MKNIFSLLTVTLSFLFSFGSSFTPGNIVVARLGDGSAALTSAATPVFLDEYTPTGTLVQSVPLPTSVSGSNHAFTLSGTATSEGALTLTANGQFLVLAGYDATVGVASVASDSTLNRTIARIDASGTVNTSTGVIANSAYKKNNIRGAASLDGLNFYCSGNGSSNTGGTYYLPFGSFTGSAVQISSTLVNTRTVNVFDNQLYVSSSSGAFNGISSVGTGLPTSTGETTTILPGFSTSSGPSTYAFYFLDLDANVPGVDVVYVCDDRTAAPDGGLYKYSLVNNTWVSNGNITSSVGLRGVTAIKTCSGVSIVVSGETGVYGIIDASGYNQPLTGSLTQLVTAGANTKLRGVAFTPGTTALSMNLTLSPTDASGSTAADGSINLTVSGGAQPISSYAWSNGSTTQNISGLVPGNYCVTVTDAGSCTASQCVVVGQSTGIKANDLIQVFDTYFSNEALYIRAHLMQPSRAVVELFDVNGKLLEQQEITSDNIAVEFPSGRFSTNCLFVRLTTDKGSVTKRVVIAR